jgi:cytochrome oxidase assembly protein ShyY1
LDALSSPAAARRHVYLAICLGVVVTIVGVLLGQWQTRRGDLKEAVQARWDAAAAAARLEGRTGDEAAGVAAGLPRRVELRGEFLPAATVFVDNRALAGRAGFQVVTPLRVSDGLVVLINRGWVMRDAADPSKRPDVDTPRGVISITGLAVERVPRILELASPPLPPLPGIWPNLPYDEFERVAGLRVVRFVVQQASESADGLRRTWVRPASGVDTHRGYALQWYGLAALSAGLTAYFGGRALRRSRT